MGPANDLLVVGAGPAGLTLALQASLAGARVRVVEQRTEPRVWAPALAIHPRTMELLRGLGVADALLARGLSRVDLAIHFGQDVVAGSLGRLHLPETEFPFIFFLPQPDVEQILAQALESLGVDIEWGTRFTRFEEHGDGLVCQVERGSAEEIFTAGFLAGCDGADSTVRRHAGIRFRGRSYRESITVADVAPIAELEPDTAHAYLRGRGILFFFPLPSGRWRVIGPGIGDDSKECVRKLAAAHTEGSVVVGEVDWVRVMRPQHRLASSYRRGRVFLVGDAAHVHSPAAAQGMNTGIQDAVNLGWKMGLVAKGAPDSLLDTYEMERRPVARQVVRLTGLAFALEVSEFAPLRWGRLWAARPIAGVLAPHPRLISAVARVVSGLDTRYRRGAVDVARTSHIGRYAGRRLPDSQIDAGPTRRLHHLVEPGAFTLLLFDGRAEASATSVLADTFADALVVRRVEAPTQARKRVDWALIRPDGYVATSGRLTELARAERYLERWIGDQFAAARSTL